MVKRIKGGKLKLVHERGGYWLVLGDPDGESNDQKEATIEEVGEHFKLNIGGSVFQIPLKYVE